MTARIEVIAHRGASADAPENTLAAFALAREQGADGVELDVRRCGSGEVVVFHDRDLVRLCGLPGVVGEMSLGELRQARVKGTEPIPTLAETLAAIAPPLSINVELKTGDALGLARAVASIVMASGAADRVLLSSFDPRILAEARVVAPALPRALIFGENQWWLLRKGWLAPLVSAQAVHPSKRLVDALWVRRWQARGFRVRVWTVDDEAELRWLWALGVDAAITNVPAAARRVFDESAAKVSQ